MLSNEVEKSIRKFMVEELMFEQAEAIQVDEELTLDSLDQTELRVFINEQFKVDTDLEKVPPEMIGTIKNIISLVQGNTSQ
jgi:acyl carrier protein